MVTFDSTLPGTPETAWATMERLAVLPALDFSVVGKLTVVAAHPDDETLGAGGLIAECSRRGITVQIIVVTDGAASHPESRVVLPGQLAAVRQRELYLAVSELAPGSEVISLGFADGDTLQSKADIWEARAGAIEPGSTIVAPWRGDGHRDHRVVGDVCAEVAEKFGLPLLEYPIWMWHWAMPDDERVPWDSALSVQLTEFSLKAKRRALACHASQVVGVGPSDADGPVLSPAFLSNFDRDREVFLIDRSARSDGSKSRGYFDALYAKSEDPWRMATRWYEERKRDITVASLPRARYESGLEVGCSTGELTASLAARCESLLAVDISDAAVSRASKRTEELSNVRVERADVTRNFPSGPFDLVMISEVAYYWDRATLRRFLTELMLHLADDATVIACHWRHPVSDYPLRGDEAHDMIRTGLSLHRIAVHDEEDFLLEAFATDPRSVAAREGLVE
jgi:LmbE family N-acetylglucosaminyl deacetylase/SAM-dependent methyltransferase